MSWSESNTHHWGDWSLADLVAARRGQRVSLVVPGRDEAATAGGGVRVGPLIDEAAKEKVQTLVDDAVAGGARVLTGGTAPDGPGYFYPPTVLTDVPVSARMGSEEIFGPVAPLTPFDTEEEEVVAAVNDTEYGLVNYVFTNDLRRGLRVAEALESGMVGLNQGVVSNPAAPFGGVKASGLGREGRSIGIEEFLETKYVGIAM